MKVTIMTPVYPPNIAIGGGVAITYGALSAKLESLGHSVQVLSPRLHNLDHGSSTLYKDFPVIFPTLANLQALSGAIQSSDVVVCPDDNNLPFLAYLCKMHDKPLLFNIHTNVQSLLEQSPRLFLNSFAAPLIGTFVTLSSHLSTETFTTSPSYAEHLRRKHCRVDGVFSPRIKLAVFTLPDSAQAVAEARAWLSNGRPHLPLLLCAGRLSHEKRIALLARAKPRGVILAVVGDGPDAAAVQALALLDDEVVVHVKMQNQDRLRTLYKACDFLVSASAFETLGMTVAEAHMCGVPVAVQSAPGFVSQVIPGRNGFLVNFDDDADEARAQLAHALGARPSRAQVLATLDERWDARLEDLQNVVLRLARAGRGDKDAAAAGVALKAVLTLVMLVYWFLYSVTTFPFNTLESRVRAVEFPLLPPAALLLAPSSLFAPSSATRAHGFSGRAVLLAIMLYAAQLDGAWLAVR
jgi:glycosyltransferase involved in cell wall biosynthesis